jgi:hypothetical protein
LEGEHIHNEKAFDFRNGIDSDSFARGMRQQRQGQQQQQQHE